MHSGRGRAFLCVAVYVGLELWRIFMLFVSRGADQQIIGVYDLPHANAVEQIAADDTQLIEFLSQPGQAKAMLSERDSEMVRVIEDLIDVLIAKRLLLPTDLPVVVQKKLQGRQLLRQQIPTSNPLLDEGDII